MNGQINPNEYRARIIHEFDEALTIVQKLGTKIRNNFINTSYD